MTGLLNPFILRASQYTIERAFGGFDIPTSDEVFLTLPPGEAGQLLVAQIGFRGSAPFAMPEGWTQIAQVATADTSLGGEVSGVMAWKIREAFEGPASFARTGGGVAGGIIVGYTPSVGGLTIDTHTVFAQPSATTALTGSALTVSAADSLLVTTAIVAGIDTTLDHDWSAAALAKIAAPSGVVPGTPSPVSRSTWGQTFMASMDAPDTAVTALGFDVAGVPAGSTGAFSGASIVSSRGLVIAAAFRRTA